MTLASYSFRLVFAIRIVLVYAEDRNCDQILDQILGSSELGGIVLQPHWWNSLIPVLETEVIELQAGGNKRPRRSHLSQ